MSMMRCRAARRSCPIHGDNGCEIQGEAGCRERAQDQRQWRADVDAELAVVDVVGGTHTDPGFTELDDAIMRIIGEYIPDMLLTHQIQQRILREVMCRTRLDAFALPDMTAAELTGALARALHDADCGCDTYDSIEDPRYITAARTALQELGGTP